MNTSPTQTSQICNITKPEDICIFSTRAYEPKYIYKIGRAVSTPKSNTEHSDDDELYVCYKKSCHDAITAEKHIHVLLNRYRYQNNREFFMMHFDHIRALIDMVCENFQKEYEKSEEIYVSTQNRKRPEINPHVSTPFVLSKDKVTWNQNNVITRYYKIQK